jgi:hypothetical protein
MCTFRGFAFLGLSCLLVAFGALAQPETPPDAADFTQLPGFPGPAASAFGVAADVLGDGSLVVYDGENIFLETSAESDTYASPYSGFTGDPGFVATAPDGTTVLVGAGAGGALWLFDTTNPDDAGDPFFALQNAFAAEFISDDTVVVDVAQFSSEGGVFTVVSELGILDLSLAGTGNTEGLYTKVVQKSEEGSASAGLVLYEDTIYAADGLTGQVRAFPTSDLLTAWNSSTTLAWEDGAAIGTFNSGGPQGVTGQGTLLIGGLDPDTFDSSVQFVSTSGELGGDVVIPQTSEAPFYGALYNPVSSKIIITATSYDTSAPTVNAYVSDEAYEEPTPPLDILQLLLDFLTGVGGLVLILLLVLLFI